MPTPRLSTLRSVKPYIGLLQHRVPLVDLTPVAIGNADVNGSVVDLQTSYRPGQPLISPRPRSRVGRNLLE